MTSFEAQGLLYDWFSKHDSFRMDEDFRKVVLLSQEQQSRDEAAVLAGLQEFEKGLVITKVNDTWVLNRPFSNLVQTVSVRPQIAQAVAECINTFCSTIKDSSNYCNPLQLVDNDILNLINIIDALTKGSDSNE